MAASKLRYLTVALAVAVTMTGMAACGSDSITSPAPSEFTLVGFPGGANYYSAVPGAIKVCSFDGPGQFTTTQAPVGGGTSIETVSNLLANECSITWLSNGNVGPFNVTVTQVGPAGFDLRRLAVIHTNPGLNQNFEDPLLCAGTMVIPSSAVVPVGGAANGAVVWFKQCSPRPPPPDGCSGLTPGYWKNWDNHYTPAQFATLIDGTVFPTLTNQQATNILKGNNPELVRLLKFLMANQLTLSLTLHPTFPNPSGGVLSGDCTFLGISLASATATALDMLANPGNYTRQQILDMGTILDIFANLGGG